jgi:hypothetical protein
LGPQPKQRLAKVQANVKPESHISCSWKCKRVWGNEPPHSKVSSQFGNWSPNGLPNLQRAIVGVNLLNWRVLYTIGKLLKFRCLKWAVMIHLGI